MRRVAGVRAVLTVAFGLMICGALGATAPAMAATGSIGGTVTDAVSKNGIGNLEVCAVDAFPGPFGECGFTDGEGDYTIPNLQPGLYKVVFAEETSQNYLAQWYSGKATKAEAEAIPVGDGALVTGIDAELALGGQITGKVTDMETLKPVEGVEVCAPEVDGGPVEGVIHCDKSDAAGEYTIQSLPTGAYKVEFFVRKSPNYIRQLYPGKASFAEATPVSVVAGGSAVPNIDAAMQRGIQVSGTVTEAGGSGLTWDARVCAHDPVSEVVVECDFPEKDGTYSIAGLPFGTYVISFAIDVEEEPGLILHPDGFVRQYYNAKPTFAAADRISAAGPAEFTDIDAQLARGPEVFPNKRPPVLPPLVVTLIERPAPKPLRCKKGFRKKLVKGAHRCVKIHKTHRRHRHNHGPHAVATGH